MFGGGQQGPAQPYSGMSHQQVMAAKAAKVAKQQSKAGRQKEINRAQHQKMYSNKQKAAPQGGGFGQIFQSLGKWGG